MENKTNTLKITPKIIIDIIFRKKTTILLTFVFGIICSFIVIQFITPVYDANVKMLVRGQNIVEAETYAPIMTRGLHSTQAEIVKSQPVLKRAVIALKLQNQPPDYEKNFCSELKKYYIDFMVKRNAKKLDNLSSETLEEIQISATIESLRDRLSVKLLPGTDIFIINVTAFTPEEAIETANVISRSYTMFDQIQQLAEVRLKYGDFHPTVIQLMDNINEATNNLSGQTLPDIQAIGTASVKILEQASSKREPVSTPKRIVLAAALLISLFVSFGLAFVRGFFDRTIKSPQDIADHLNVPCIGSIPKKQRKDKYLITDDSPDTRYYKFYEELSEQLLVFLKTQGLKTAIITSPSRGNNHKYIIPNLGYFLSRIMGIRVLLIDVNFNNPNFQKIYSIKEEKCLDGNMSQDMSEELICKLDNGPDIIPAKNTTEKPSNLLQNINFKSFIESKKNDYDIILIDATSINNMKDVSFMSEYSDGIVLIIDEGKLQSQMLMNSLQRLVHNNTIIVGGVLNNRTFPIPEFVYKNFKYYIN